MFEMFIKIIRLYNVLYSSNLIISRFKRTIFGSYTSSNISKINSCKIITKRSYILKSLLNFIRYIFNHLKC